MERRGREAANNGPPEREGVYGRSSGKDTGKWLMCVATHYIPWILEFLEQRFEARIPRIRGPFAVVRISLVSSPDPRLVATVAGIAPTIGSRTATLKSRRWRTHFFVLLPDFHLHKTMNQAIMQRTAFRPLFISCKKLGTSRLSLTWTTARPPRPTAF